MSQHITHTKKKTTKNKKNKKKKKKKKKKTNSSSLLDLILTRNNTLIFSGVRDQFLTQELRFHCPVYGNINFSKHLRQKWSYDQGDYNLLKQKASTKDWDTLHNPDVNTRT